MSILMPTDTRRVLGANAGKCEARSLAYDRFADPQLTEDERRVYFERAINRPALPEKAIAWRRFLVEGLRITPQEILFGELQSRLILNASGGVMVNAGLCLDRFSGVPFIPGSAIKACARRTALEKLREQSDRTAKVDGIVAIARLFGWGDQEWKDGCNQYDEFFSDFEYASGPGADWIAVRASAAEILRAQLGLAVDSRKPTWEQLGSYGGDARFLPAYPWEPQPTGDLELDILTCHHQDYYKDPRKEFAPDTEEPNPVVFPTVSRGLIFAFAVLGKDTDSAHAVREWLKSGLNVYGLGGKTSAGYGWFDTSDELQERQRISSHSMIERERETDRKRQEEKDRTQKALAEREATLKLRQDLEGLPPDQQEDLKVARLSPDQFRSKVENLANLAEMEKLAVYRALRGERQEFWHFMRDRNDKGKRPWSVIVPQIFTLAKSRKEKMP